MRRARDCAQVITGVVATTVAAPFDTIESRVMARGGKRPVLWTALRSLVAREGPRRAPRGLVARLLPPRAARAIDTFPRLEQLRGLRVLLLKPRATGLARGTR